MILPVIGASTSTMVFSCRNNFAPSSMIFNATSSVTRPSAMKCALRTSTRGLPRESNTSYALKRTCGGHGMSRSKINDRQTKEMQWMEILLFITRSDIGGDIALFAVVIVVDEDVVGEDASETLVDDEEFDILFDTVVLVAITIMIYRSGRCFSFE